MKSNIKQQLESAIRDKKGFIKAYGSNIAEYFQEDFANQYQGHTWYLTDEEIELWENSENEEVRLINEIQDFLEQYNIDIEEYLGEKVESAY